MEKVIVIKRIPGILEIGDILTAEGSGQDFILEQAKKTRTGSSERYVNLDYETVCDNIPEYFEFIVEERDSVRPFEVIRSNKEIFDRYNSFIRSMNESNPGTEQDVVYHNLIWFIEWLTGNKELIKY